MPTYDYKCNKCENEFELRQPITAEPVAACPSCGGTSKRMFTTIGGIHFKGSGFHVNDYKSSTPAKAENASSGQCDCSQSCPHAG